MINVRSILLNVSQKDEISGLDRICDLIESYLEGRAAMKPIIVVKGMIFILNQNPTSLSL